MRRVFAVVAAIAMVAGSLALRSRLDKKSADQALVLRLTCATELESPCMALAKDDSRIKVTVEAAGLTADRLATNEGDVGLDGWLSTAPWPDIVDQERRVHSLEPLFASSRPTLARSPLVIAMWKDRAAALGGHCGGTVGWRCLGDAAGTAGGWPAIGGRAEWGPVKVGHGPPATDGVGLLVLGQAVGSWFGRPEVSTIDLDDSAFQGWFGGLERSVPTSAGSPLETMLATGPAAFDAVGTTEAEAGPQLARAARGKQVDLLYPSPMATADVVLAVPPGRAKAPATLRGVVGGSAGRRALAVAGWRVDGEAKAQGVSDTPALPAAANLPAPGLLDALRARWHEVTGK